MHTRAAAAIAVSLTIGIAADGRAQAPADGAGAPHAMTRAAGMPLRDGALAPGMLTVRVVRGSFDLNAANETVSVELAGGRVESARTGADGRAQFAHLPIGATVRATAVVDGQALASERFEMAPESGIRVLLIAGDGAATASGVADVPPAVPPEPGAPAVAGAVTQRPADVARSDETVQLIRVVLAAATAGALSFVVFGRFGWRPGRGRRTPAA